MIKCKKKYKRKLKFTYVYGKTIGLCQVVWKKNILGFKKLTLVNHYQQGKFIRYTLYCNIRNLKELLKEMEYSNNNEAVSRISEKYAMSIIKFTYDEPNF